MPNHSQSFYSVETNGRPVGRRRSSLSASTARCGAIRWRGWIARPGPRLLAQGTLDSQVYALRRVRRDSPMSVVALLRRRGTDSSIRMELHMALLLQCLREIRIQSGDPSLIPPSPKSDIRPAFSALVRLGLDEGVAPTMATVMGAAPAKVWSTEGDGQG